MSLKGGEVCCAVTLGLRRDWAGFFGILPSTCAGHSMLCPYGNVQA
jgi:hypothetical protein